MAKTETNKTSSKKSSPRTAPIRRRVLCISIPHLYLQLAHRYMKIKSGLSLIIASGLQAESYVVDLSKDLLTSGIKKGMLLKEIEGSKVRPQILPAPYELSEKIRFEILKFLSEFSPEVKSPSPGEYFINLTGTRKLMGREIDTATRIAFKILCAFKLTTSCGIGSTPQLARIASVIAGSGGVYEIFPEAENLFLARLSPLLIPGISGATKRKLLDEYNISSISELWQMDSEELLALFGKEGLILLNHSRGEGTIYSTRCTEKRLFRDTRTIPVATSNPGVIHSVIYELLSALCTRSRSEALSPGNLSLSFIYQDNYTKTLNRKLKGSSNSEREIYPDIKQMAEKLLTRRVKIKKIELIFSELHPASQQLLLFDEQSNELKLNETLKHLPSLVAIPGTSQKKKKNDSDKNTLRRTGWQ